SMSNGASRDTVSSSDETRRGGNDRRVRRRPRVARRDRQPAEARLSMLCGKPMIAAAAVAGAVALSPPAHAEDFFSTLFGAIGRVFHPPSSSQPPFGGDQTEAPRPRASLGGPAWCVRTCDGRYFPIPASEQSR